MAAIARDVQRRAAQRAERRVAQRLREIDESDDSTAISMLARMKLPQMTGQIRDVEQRALEIAREEGREEFRVKALMHNLVHHTLPTVIATAKGEPASSSGALSGPPPLPLGPAANAVAGLKFAYPPSVGRNAHTAASSADADADGDGGEEGQVHATTAAVSA